MDWGRGEAGQTGHYEAYWHEDPDKVVDDFKHRPFLGAEELPGPRGENEGVPSGDGQRAHKKVLVGREVGRELEGVWKKACGGSVVSSRTTKPGLLGRTDNVGHGCEEGGREGLSRWRAGLGSPVI